MRCSKYDHFVAAAFVIMQAEAVDITFSNVAGIAREFNGTVVDHCSDTIVIIWPDEPQTALKRKIKAAVLCALKIEASIPKIRTEQDTLTNGVTLDDLKCGVGNGTVSLLVCGGCLGRLYCIPTGPAYRQAFDAIATHEVCPCPFAFVARC